MEEAGGVAGAAGVAAGVALGYEKDACVMI